MNHLFIFASISHCHRQRMEDSSYSNFAESSETVSATRQTRSGIKLIVPPLKSAKLASQSKKVDKKAPPPPPPVPRPPKLKLLKDVLQKLITVIKKKDDYALFLEPVNATTVPGYADIITYPMDFGTMTKKVEHGKYRSLEEFTNDLCLVTSNAKTFNPPGSIYYTEAERIEKWSLMQISKASSTVIEYETDWNIDIQNEGATPNMSDDEANTELPSAVDGEPRDESPSTISSTPTVGGRRPLRATNTKKKEESKPLETIDANGHLPGAKDGIGAFPLTSPWADVMVALKIKGKRYRTKKERLRMEKTGAPYAADGSLNYPEMEDPFTVLSSLVPEPEPSHPFVEPLIQVPGSSPEATLAPVNLPFKRAEPDFSVPLVPNKKRKHWDIIRNFNPRKTKEKDEDEVHQDVDGPSTSRKAHHLDYGVYATLHETLTQASSSKDIASESSLLRLIRSKTYPRVHSSTPEAENENIYFSHEKALIADKYLIDTVYGGPDGLAYIRSLAEFLEYPHDAQRQGECSELGMPLTEWVKKNIVDHLTNGNHAVLRQTSDGLQGRTESIGTVVSTQIARSRYQYPQATEQMQELLRIHAQQIDMACLLKNPAELLTSDREWLSHVLASQDVSNNVKQEEDTSKVDDDQKMNGGSPIGDERSIAILNETPELMTVALNDIAESIINLNQYHLEHGGKVDSGGVEEEEVLELRQIRRHLISLAKRAPLNQIAGLPPDLVPPTLRQYVSLVS